MRAATRPFRIVQVVNGSEQLKPGIEHALSDGQDAIDWSDRLNKHAKCHSGQSRRNEFSRDVDLAAPTSSTLTRIALT